MLIIMILFGLALVAVAWMFAGPELAGIVAFLYVILFGTVGLSYSYSHYNERTVVVTVTDKDRGGDEGSYRVYTEDDGTFANVDSWWRGKVDSADVWQQIEPGHTYRFHVVGWRLGLTSDFPNILDVQEVG